MTDICCQDRKNEKEKKQQEALAKKAELR